MIVALSLQTLAAQDRPRFEVATVKENRSGNSIMSIVPMAGGRLDARNVTLRFLLQLAYKLSDAQIQGGPGWIGTTRFDIVAKAESDKPFPDMTPMMQSLLEDEFKLQFHRETKSLPVLVLVPVRSGSKVSVTEASACLTNCGTIRMTRRSIAGSRIKTAAFIKALSQVTGEIVVDETGFTDLLDANLVWGDAGEDSPSLFTVLSEQMGLKLESRKVPVEILVIDTVSRPAYE